MSTTYPTSLQDLDATRGSSDSLRSSPSHSGHHANEDDTIEALQAKVGVNNSLVTSSLDYKVTQLETNATLNTDTDVKANDWVVDEDDMVSNLDTKVPTQQSVKKYVDDNIGTPYTLPTAAAGTLGGVKVGTRLSIDGSGVLSADVQSGGGDVVAPATHAASYIPQWNATPDSKTLVEGVAMPAGGLAGLTALGGKAATDQTFYIGTTQVAINRASAALTLAGLTLTTPNIGTPSAGVVTNLTGTASININGTVGATTPTTIVGTTIQANTGFVPDANDGAYLGTSALGFADLFLASGGVINWANGNATLTHSTGLLTSNVPLSIGTSNALTAGTIELGHASDTTLSRTGAGAIAVEGVAIPTISSTSTLTNKRITKRVATTTDDATAVINIDTTDVYELSAVANATTISTTGTPTDGQNLMIRLKDAGVGKALTWDAAFVAIGVTAPTTTVAGKWHYIGCQYNSAAAKWHVLAVGQEA